VRIRLACCALALLCAASPSQALLCGSGLPLASGISVSTTDLSFNNYTPASADFANTTVSVACGLLGLDILPAFSVSLTAMNGSGPATRYLVQGGTHLNYNVYTTSGYSVIWGDNSGGSATENYAGLLSLGSVSFTGWGRLPAGQYVAAGPYTDRITVTVTY
jgi:spore coat protein U-like protein